MDSVGSWGRKKEGYVVVSVLVVMFGSGGGLGGLGKMALSIGVQGR